MRMYSIPPPQWATYIRAAVRKERGLPVFKCVAGQ